MEQWFEIWGHNLITTSNLALNRAWLARLPIVQTGNDFINLNSLDWALDLHQFPSDPCAIACKNNDLPLLERLFSLGFTMSDEGFKYGFSFGSITMIEQLMKGLMPKRLGYYLKRPAKLGRPLDHSAPLRSSFKPRR